jgi:hypothetical protein
MPGKSPKTVLVARSVTWPIIRSCRPAPARVQNRERGGPQRRWCIQFVSLPLTAAKPRLKRENPTGPCTCAKCSRGLVGLDSKHRMRPPPGEFEPTYSGHTSRGPSRPAIVISSSRARLLAETSLICAFIPRSGAASSVGSGAALALSQARRARPFRPFSVACPAALESTSSGRSEPRWSCVSYSSHSDRGWRLSQHPAAGPRRDRCPCS